MQNSDILTYPHLRRILLSFLAACGIGNIAAQTYSRPEAAEMVQTLYAADLLSDHGRETIGEVLSSNARLPVFTPRRVYYPERRDSLSAGQLLGVLYTVYQSAYAYRRGMTADEDVLLRWQRRPDFNMDMVNSPAFLAAVERRRREIPGYQFERQVLEGINADSTVRWAEWVDSWTAIDDIISDTLVPADRSVFGPEVMATLQTVYELGLIGQDTFDRYREKIDTEGIYPDYYLLKQLAEGAGIRETEEKRVRERRFAIRYLAERGLIDTARVQNLLRDSILLRAPDDRLLYEYVEPQIGLTLRKPENLEDLVTQFHRQLCEFDPQLCGVEIEVVRDTTDTSEAYARYWLTGLVGGWQSERSSEIYTYPAAAETPWHQVYSAEVLLQPFNTYLTSINAAYRLYTLGLMAPQNHNGPVELQLFPLTSRAAHAISSPLLKDALDYPSGPEPAGFISPDEASEILDTLDKLGFLVPLDARQLVEAKACLLEATLGGLPDFFRCLPDLYLTGRERGGVPRPEKLEQLSDLPGRFYGVPARVYGRRDLYLKFEQPVVDFLVSRFPFALQSLN